MYSLCVTLSSDCMIVAWLFLACKVWCNNTVDDDVLFRHFICHLLLKFSHSQHCMNISWIPWKKLRPVWLQNVSWCWSSMGLITCYQRQMHMDWRGCQNHGRRRSALSLRLALLICRQCTTWQIMCEMLLTARAYRQILLTVVSVKFYLSI